MFESNTGTNTLSVVNNTTPLPIADAGGSLTVDNGGTFAVQAAQSGTWTVQPGNTANTTAWLMAGGKTNNNAAPGATNFGALTALANASAPTWTEGNLVALSTDLAGALRVSGAVSCSNCSGSGASKVDDAAFTIASDSVAPAGFLADQVTPDSVNEGDVGLARMTLARIQLNTLWDAAGNERGANVNASNELLVSLSTVGAAGALADNTANPTVGAIATYNMCFDGSTWDRCQSSTITEVTEDAAETAAAVGTYAMTVRRDSAASSAGTDGDNATLNTDSLGRLWVNCGTGCSGGTQYTHDAALTIGSSSTTLAGARASAAVPTDVSADNDAVALWALRSGALAIQPTYGGVLASTGNGASGTGVLRVTVANDSTGLLSVNPGTAANWGVYVEDAAETAGGNLSMAGSVRRDTLASSAGSSGDNATINTNAIGALWTSDYDPCSSEAKTTAPFSLTARGVVIAAAASKKNYICSIAVVAGAAEVFNLVEGTGTTCQTSTAAVVGSTTAANGLSFAANGGFTATGGNASAIAGIGTNVDTCIVPSGSNRLSGYVTYVQR